MGCKVAAVSDVHSPRYLSEFFVALREVSEDPEIFVMAGDMIDKGRVAFLDPVISRIKRILGDLHFVAVFGNEEYRSVHSLLRTRYPEVKWLDDELEFFECKESLVAIVGTTGSLERPTRWQARNLPSISKLYRERPRLVASMIKKAKTKTSKVVLVSHYALSKETVIGEPASNWPWLYSPAMEASIVNAKPTIAIHGHAHKGRPYALLGTVPIYNVAFPLNKKIVIIDV